MKNISSKILTLATILVLLVTLSVTALASTIDSTEKAIADIGAENEDIADVRAIEEIEESSLLNTPKIKSVRNDGENIIIDWDAVQGAYEYRLFYDSTGNKGWKAIKTTANTSYEWSGATPGKTYVFTVRCVAEDGSFASDYDHNGFKYLFYLETPAVTKFEPNNSNGINVSWNAIKGATYYRVFYLNGSKWTTIGDTTKTTYSVPRPAYKETRIYTVRCISEDKTWQSDYDHKGFSYTFSLETPKIKEIKNNDVEGIDISWNPVQGASYYMVFYWNGSKWKVIGDTTKTKYNCIPGEYNKEIRYTIRCCNAQDQWESDYDNVGKSFKYGLPTPKISKVQINDEDNSLDIYWDKIEGATYYRVFFQTADSWKTIGETTGTVYKWGGFVAGQTYVFTVRCTNISGRFVSDFDEKGFQYTVQISTPKINSVTKASDSSVKISWNSVAGAYKYRVFYWNDTSWKTIGDTASTSYVWGSPVVGKTYKYTVRCISESRQYSSGYDKVGFSYTLLLNTPKLSSIKTVNNTQVTLSWGSVNGAKLYRVFYKTDTSWKTIADTSSTSYTWKSPEIGKEYTYTVRCLSSDKKYWTSDYSRTGMNHKVLLNTPKIKSCTPTSNKGFKISWDAIPGATYYRVFQWINSEGGYRKVGDTSDKNYVVNGAIGYEYRITVRCISKDCTTYQSDYDKEGFKYYFYLDTPKVNSVKPAGGNKATISWKAVTGAVRYWVFNWSDDESKWKYIGSATSASYTWKGAEVNQKYLFTVRCISNDDKGTWQSGYDTKGFSYTHQLLSPEITSVEKVNLQTVKIIWGNVEGAFAYKVFYKTGSGGWTGITTTRDTKYIWDGAKTGVKYTYTVRCIDEYGDFASDYDHVGYSFTIYSVGNKIAEVALTELDYWKDGMHGYDCQGRKYWKDLAVPAADWCGYFATYCCKHAGVVEFQGNKTIYGFVGAWEQWGKEHGEWHSSGSGYIPQPGDMVIWGEGNDHVSVVVQVYKEDGKYRFKDIGGNEGYTSYFDYDESIVKMDDYAIDYWYIKGFVGTHTMND